MMRIAAIIAIPTAPVGQIIPIASALDHDLSAYDMILLLSLTAWLPSWIAVLCD